MLKGEGHHHLKHQNQCIAVTVLMVLNMHAGTHKFHVRIECMTLKKTKKKHIKGMNLD